MGGRRAAEVDVHAVAQDAALLGERRVERPAERPPGHTQALTLVDGALDEALPDDIALLVHLVGPLGPVDLADLGRREVVDRINAEALGRHQDGGPGADLVAVTDLRHLAAGTAMDSNYAPGQGRV